MAERIISLSEEQLNAILQLSNNDLGRLTDVFNNAVEELSPEIKNLFKFRICSSRDLDTEGNPYGTYGLELAVPRSSLILNPNNLPIEELTMLCAVTGASFKRSELVRAFEGNGFYDNQVVYIHPSVVDKPELSKFVTTLTGKIAKKNGCWSGESPDGETVYLMYNERHVAGVYDYFICNDCDGLFRIDERHHLMNFGSNVCDTCLGNYEACPDCGEYISSDDDASCGNCGWGQNVIHDYSYKPACVFHGKGDVLNPFMGTELEIECKRGARKDMAMEVKDHFGKDESKFYNKYDSSLDGGFEIVSHPMTLSEHLKLDYKGLFDSLTRQGARSHNTSTCGLHVHIDKTRMKDAHKVRFGAFFALARHKLEVLARRKSEDYAAFKHKSCSLTEFIAEDNRYQAVNWTNPNTVEVRIFKGTLKYSTFMASVELCQAIYSFTYERNSFLCEFEENAIWDRFNKWVNRTSKKRFTFLKAYLIEKAELLAKAIDKDNDIIRLEKDRKIKRKKLRLTDNIIDATLNAERKDFRRGEFPSFIYDRPDEARDVTDNYRYHARDTGVINIDLDNDYETESMF